MLALRTLRECALRKAVSPRILINQRPGVRALSLSSGSQFQQPSRSRFPRLRSTLPTGIRFNSTASPASPVPPPPPTSSSDVIDSAIESAQPVLSPDQMGYLQSLGVDLGWGTSSMIQVLLESVHLYSGLPWWGAIIASISIVRLLQFPFYCKMSDTVAKLKEANVFLKPLADKMQEAQKRGDMQGMLQARAEHNAKMKMAGVNRMWLMFPISQIPIFYGFYKNLMGMSKIPVPELQTDGLAWFHDLSVADPTYIIPAVAAGTIGVQIMLGGESGSGFSRNVKLALGVGLPVISFFVTCSWPAALTFYLAINSLIGAAQTLALKNRSLRQALDLYPLSEQPTANPLKPIQYTPRNILDDLKKTGKLPQVTQEISASKPKQIGGEGSLLDKLTGKADKDAWSLKKWKESSQEKVIEQKYKAYETHRLRQLEEAKKALEAERERKRQQKRVKL